MVHGSSTPRPRVHAVNFDTNSALQRDVEKEGQTQGCSSVALPGGGEMTSSDIPASQESVAGARGEEASTVLKRLENRGCGCPRGK